MKELSIEQKAKRYDLALERANSLLSGNQLGNAWIYKLLPELKESEESEDERIRKEILDYIIKGSESLYDVQQYGKERFEKWVAWLEKRGEQDNNEDSDILQRFSFYSYKDEPNILYLSGLYVNKECRNKGIGTKILEIADEVAKSLNCHVIRLKTKKNSNAERLYQAHGYNSLATEERDGVWLEKQGEHKPTAEEVLIKAGLKPYKDGNQWCVLLGDNIQEGVCGFGNTIEDALYAFLKDLIASQGEQKSVKVPKFKAGDFIQFNGMGHTRYTVKEVCGLSHYINTLDKRMDMSYTDANFELVEQKPAEWSEEDKERIEQICHDLKSGMINFYANEVVKGLHYKEIIESNIEWLKSLRPQSTWKPSEEQMNGLKEAIEFLGCTKIRREQLQSLYEQLKKLKE